MSSSTLFARRLLIAVLPSFALLAGACSDDDVLDSSSGAGKAGAAGSNVSFAGAAGSAGSAGRGGSTASSGAAGEGGATDSAGTAGEGDAAGSSGAAGKAGSNGSSGAAGKGGSSGFSGSSGGGAGRAGSSGQGGAGGGLAALGPAPVLLGTAANYAILAQSTVTNVPTSAITGNLGLSPAAASYFTGFSPTKVGTYWTSPQVVGGLFAADNDAPTPSDLTTAIGNMQAAYTDAAGRPSPDFLNLGGGAIGGLTLVPGLYKWASSVSIPADVSLVGAANDVWIFQISGDLSLSSAKAMALSGGAQAKNVFWQIAGAVDMGTTSHAEGILLCKTAIVLGAGASINGRLLAQTAVNLASNTVTQPAP